MTREKFFTNRCIAETRFPSRLTWRWLRVTTQDHRNLHNPGTRRQIYNNIFFLSLHQIYARSNQRPLSDWPDGHILTFNNVLFFPNTVRARCTVQYYFALYYVNALHAVTLQQHRMFRALSFLVSLRIGYSARFGRRMFFPFSPGAFSQAISRILLNRW